MVTFVCYFCDKTMKKKQCDRHIQMCGRPIKLCCIDCRKWFEGNSYKAHTSCVSEEEQYFGKFWKGHKDYVNPKKKAQKKPVEVQEKKEAQITPKTNILEWSGWKKSIKKVVKKSEGNTLPLKKLRKAIRKMHAAKFGKMEKSAFKEKFQKKLKKINKLKIQDKTVSYLKSN